MDNKINNLMKKELKNLGDYSNRIREIVKQGIVSERFGSYLEELCLINFTSIESTVFVQQRDIERAGKSLADCALSLDRIASIYFNFSFLRNGIPNYYQSLFDLAKERYKETFDKCVKILESLK